MKEVRVRVLITTITTTIININGVTTITITKIKRWEDINIYKLNYIER